MRFFAKLNLRQRYNLAVFIAICTASCLLVCSMYLAMSSYAHDYTGRYWQDFASTFADSASYPVIVDSASGGLVAVHNLDSDKHILKSSIYGAGQRLLASSGSAGSCQWPKTRPDKAIFTVMDSYWCFSSPIHHEGKTIGNVELVVSKMEYHAVVRQMLVASVLIVLVFSLLIFCIVSYFSGFFTSTIVEMVNVLKFVGQGATGCRVSFSGAADIDMMRDVFNDMLTKIELNEQILERIVADRTNELKAALDSSQSANAYKSQIMALVTHEMKTPVHNAIGFMQIVKDELPKSPGFDLLRNYQSRALTNTNELKGMIENILLQGMLEADKYGLSHSKVNVKTLIAECSDNAIPLRTRNRNHLSLSGNDETIVSDADALRHVINNLIGNACKFTLDGEIQVTWWLDHGQLTIEVADTGCGIAQENHQKIFDAFWQEPQKNLKMGRKYSGHGLGLAITKRLVERLAGTISVMPNKDKGTVFTVRVPYSEAKHGRLQAGMTEV